MIAEENAPEVSVVMPCLDEARTLAACIREALDAMTQAGIAGEVVIADNGSTDGSREIAAARGRFILMGDADGSYDYSHLPRFVARLRAGDDLVMGNRFKGGVQPG